MPIYSWDDFLGYNPGSLRVSFLVKSIEMKGVFGSILSVTGIVMIIAGVVGDYSWWTGAGCGLFILGINSLVEARIASRIESISKESSDSGYWSAMFGKE